MHSSLTIDPDMGEETWKQPPYGAVAAAEQECDAPPLGDGEPQNSVTFDNSAVENYEQDKPSPPPPNLFLPGERFASGL